MYYDLDVVCHLSFYDINYYDLDVLQNHFFKMSSQG